MPRRGSCSSTEKSVTARESASGTPHWRFHVERQVHDAPRQAHDESGRQHSMPLAEFGSSEPRPADLLEEGGDQPATTGHQQGRLVLCCDDAGRKTFEVSQNGKRIAIINSG